MSENKEESNRIVNDFYNKLRKLLRRMNPYDFCKVASGLMRLSLSGSNLRKYYPPHILLQSMEENCYYYDAPFQRILTKEKFDNVINLYKSFSSPYQLHELSEGTSKGLLNFFISLR